MNAATLQPLRTLSVGKVRSHGLGGVSWPGWRATACESSGLGDGCFRVGLGAFCRPGGIDREKRGRRTWGDPQPVNGGLGPNVPDFYGTRMGAWAIRPSMCGGDQGLLMDLGVAYKEAASGCLTSKGSFLWYGASHSPGMWGIQTSFSGFSWRPALDSSLLSPPWEGWTLTWQMPRIESQGSREQSLGLQPGTWPQSRDFGLFPEAPPPSSQELVA